VGRKHQVCMCHCYNLYEEWLSCLPLQASAGPGYVLPSGH
jgi:hypothetical protein